MHVLKVDRTISVKGPLKLTGEGGKKVVST